MSDYGERLAEGAGLGLTGMDRQAFANGVAARNLIEETPETFEAEACGHLVLDTAEIDAKGYCINCATLPNCVLCGKRTAGSVGAAGLRWSRICQPCKDKEDKAALAQLKIDAELYRYLAKRFATGCAIIAALLVCGSTTANARGHKRKAHAGPYKAHAVRWRLK